MLAGLVLVLAGFLRAASADAGFPWNTRYGGPVEGPVGIAITHEDGTVETYEVATHEEADALVERRHDELYEEYDLGARALQGKLMMLGGGSAAIVGGVLIVRRPRDARAR